MLYVRSQLQVIQDTLIQHSNTNEMDYIEDTLISTQHRIDTIVRAFNRLPASELERIGIDLSQPILSGTDQAKKLFDAWKTRQEEFRKAVESMAKPAEHMKNICNVLKDPQSSLQQLKEALREIESLLSDVDNAKDFYTIGGWPLLIDQLSNQYNDIPKTIETRALAAWSIGTAVKNNYDYQLWMLENSPKSNLNALEYLVEALTEPITPESEDLHKKCLYALSSAARGNIDVQTYILFINIPKYGNLVDILSYLVSSNSTSMDILRKVWSFSADLLEERRYIRDELANVENLNANTREEISSYTLLGDEFCSSKYALTVLSALQKYSTVEPYSKFLQQLHHNFDITNLPNTSLISQDNVHSSSSPEVSHGGSLPVYRATVEHLLIVVREQARQCPASLLSSTPHASASIPDARTQYEDMSNSSVYITGLLRRVTGTSRPIPRNEEEKDEEVNDALTRHADEPEDEISKCVLETLSSLQKFLEETRQSCLLQGLC